MTGKWKNNREDRLKDGRKMEGQTERLIGGLTDRSKITHTDGQLIDQTYSCMDRQRHVGRADERINKQKDGTDRQMDKKTYK